MARSTLTRLTIAATTLSWTAALALAITEAGPDRLHMTVLTGALVATLWAIVVAVGAATRQHVDASIDRVTTKILNFDRGYTLAARTILQGLYDHAAARSNGTVIK